jgi:hypothetical protein
LRIPFGRRSAVPVALVAATLVIAAASAAPTLGADPPGLSRFMDAIGQVESGGRYDARNPGSGAYGKYQIMPSSWRAWAGRYLGDPDARPTPANQERVAAARLRALYRSLESWPRVAHWWLTGSSRTTGWSDYATRYVNRVMRLYDKATTRDKATTPVVVAKSTLQRFSETAAGIAYGGSWRSASHRGYAGGAVRYATAAGAKATFTFTGSSLVWYGPVGPTRGKARVFIDGTLARTVDLYGTAFEARKAVFTRTWAAAGKHTVVIEVAGTTGRPYVAIDELAVTS